MDERFDWANATFRNGDLSVPLLRDETPQWRQAVADYVNDALRHLGSVTASSVRVEMTAPRTLILSDLVGNEASIPEVVAKAVAIADAREEPRLQSEAQAREARERQKREQQEADERRTRQIREAALQGGQ